MLKGREPSSYNAKTLRGLKLKQYNRPAYLSTVTAGQEGASKWRSFWAVGTGVVAPGCGQAVACTRLKGPIFRDRLRRKREAPCARSQCAGITLPDSKIPLPTSEISLLDSEIPLLKSEGRASARYSICRFGHKTPPPLICCPLPHDLNHSS